MSDEVRVRESIEPTYDRLATGDRFTVEVRENGRRLSYEPSTDPFINTTVHPRGWRAALSVLLKRYSVSVHVSGDHDIVEDVSELDSDYLGDYRSTRRRGWNERVERSLLAFADSTRDVLR